MWRLRSAITTDKLVKCWGAGADGALGSGSVHDVTAEDLKNEGAGLEPVDLNTVGVKKIEVKQVRALVPRSRTPNTILLVLRPHRTEGVCVCVLCVGLSLARISPT